ncbi:MAG: histidine phosphatase family protein [Comamonadaceae bacterium]|nr:MAG: histidine phosphatase family protein [Comamonadaceae bacterium]
MRDLLSALVLLWAGLTIPFHAAAEDTGWRALGADGAIVLFRHAQAPGVRDPAGFVLGDCGTQRNLSEAGRDQARRLGERFRSAGVRVGQVLSSQWCRTRETAELAFPGQVRDEPAFNSFFEERPAEPAQTRAALDRLAAWRGPGVLVVLTHQVNITALTGVYPASGEGIVVRPQGRRPPTVVARLKP